MTLMEATGSASRSKQPETREGRPWICNCNLQAKLTRSSSPGWGLWQCSKTEGKCGYNKLERLELYASKNESYPSGQARMRTRENTGSAFESNTMNNNTNAFMGDGGTQIEPQDNSHRPTITSNITFTLSGRQPHSQYLGGDTDTTAVPPRHHGHPERGIYLTPENSAYPHNHHTPYHNRYRWDRGDVDQRFKGLWTKASNVRHHDRGSDSGSDSDREYNDLWFHGQPITFRRRNVQSGDEEYEEIWAIATPYPSQRGRRRAYRNPSPMRSQPLLGRSPSRGSSPGRSNCFTCICCSRESQ